MVDVYNEFKSTVGLGADIPCVAVVKRAHVSLDFAAREADREQMPVHQRYLQRLRDEVSDGYVELTTVPDFSEGRPASWRKICAEPHDAYWHANKVFVASTGEVKVFDARSGSEINSYGSSYFTNIHSISPDPRSERCFIIANPGGDDILKLDTQTGKIGAVWNPLDNGLSIGPFGVTLTTPAGVPNLDPCIEVLDASAAREALLARRSPQTWAILVDRSQTTHRLGLEKWQRAVEPNWAAFDKRGAFILASG